MNTPSEPKCVARLPSTFDFQLKLVRALARELGLATPDRAVLVTLLLVIARLLEERENSNSGSESEAEFE